MRPGIAVPTTIRGLRVFLAAVSILLVPVGHVDAQAGFMYLRGQSVHPAYEGWWPNDDGSYTLWFGYMNVNWEQEPDVPIGLDNYFSLVEPGELDDVERGAYNPSEADRGQPTHFYPRRNPFLFTVTVPEGFEDYELVWTLKTHGIVHRAYASLRADYRVSPQVMSLEVGGGFGSQDDRMRTNLPPRIDVEGDLHRSVQAGEPLTFIAFAEDPDNFPDRDHGRGDRGRLPADLEQLYSTDGIGGVTAQGAPGLRLSWTVYRGPGRYVTFQPDQLKAWMDPRVWANSPWSPPYVMPDIPPGNKWVTRVIFHEPGEYVLRAVASDGSHFSYENVVILVRP